MSRIIRLVLVLAVLAATTMTGATFAAARPFPLPDDAVGAAATPAPVAAVGTPGWQVVVIVAVATLVAAVIAYQLGSRSSRQRHDTPAFGSGPTAAAA